MHRVTAHRLWNSAGFMNYMHELAWTNPEYRAAKRNIDDAMKAGKTVVGPVPLHQPKPAYPKLTSGGHAEAYMFFAVIIDATGTTKRVIYLPHPDLPADPAFVDAGMQALTQWTYIPCTLDGVPTSCADMPRMSFRLEF